MRSLRLRYTPTSSFVYRRKTIASIVIKHVWLLGSHENKNSDAVQIAQSPFLLELKFTIIICVVPKYSYDVN